MRSAFKWLALILIFLNLGYFAWAFILDNKSDVNKRSGKNMSRVTDTGLGQGGNKLELLSELESRGLLQEKMPKESGDLFTAAKPYDLELSADGAAGSKRQVELLVTEPYCPSLGPFSKKVMAEDLQGELLNSSVKSQLRPINGESNQKFRVFLPSYSTKALADDVLKKLRAKNIDSYILSTPPFNNAISLGVFSSQVSAEGFVKKMRSSGHPAKIQATQVVQTIYWLDIFHNSELETVDHALISAMTEIKGLTRIDSPCKAIALP